MSTSNIETAGENASYSLKAVIDLGSTSIRMAVAQINADGSYQTLDTLHQSVSIGSDTFSKGQISRRTIEESVKVLRNFLSVLAEYRIDLHNGVRAVATSAVREARNRDEFLDRVYIATGIDVEVIEGTEVNRLTFMGIRPVLAANANLLKDRLLVVEVGGGSTELLGLDNGRVSVAHTYRMGSYRLRESMEAQSGTESQQMEVLETDIDAGIRQCRDAATPGERVAMMMMGGEARLAARLVEADWDEKALVSIKVSALEKLARTVLEQDIEAVVSMYRLSFEEAQTLGTALQVYVRMAKAFRLKRVYVCGVTLRDGLLAEAAFGNAWTDDFVDQILHSVHELGLKYEFDEAHANCVSAAAQALFQAMQPEHQLKRSHEVILMVAAQLHDIGMFIGNSGHHKHSKYLIENSDIFGLGEKNVQLCALVARYHRRALPRNGHTDYAALTREERLVVNKLASILRVADALDRSHTQMACKFNVVCRERQVLIEPDCNGDFTAEKRALAEKGTMFEQVYGRTVVLRTSKRR